MDSKSDTEQTSSLFRLREGWIASLFLLSALLILLGLTRADVIHYSQQLGLFYISAAMLALSIPGPIIRLWDLPGQLFLWNAGGWCLGLSVLGMASIGAMPMLPLVLMGFALTFWPRPDNVPIPWLGAAIAFVGGFLLCWALWGNVYADIPFTTV